MIAPANMRVINARCNPEMRSAGKPTNVPIIPVARPASTSTSGKGKEVAYSSRAAAQAPTASRAI